MVHDLLNVQVVCGRGNNLHEVEDPDGRQFLASMPTKFRRNVWIKRGIEFCIQAYMYLVNYLLAIIQCKCITLNL